MAFVTCGTHPPYRREDLDVARELATRSAELVDERAQRERDRTLAETLTVEEREHQLAPGDIVMFLTDGMVERSDEDYAASSERLVRAIEAVADRSLDELCDHALDATTPPLGRRDDCCLLAFKITAR